MKLIPSTERCGLTLICVCSKGEERATLYANTVVLPISSSKRLILKNSDSGFQKGSPEMRARKLSSSNKWEYRVYETLGGRGWLKMYQPFKADIERKC